MPQIDGYRICDLLKKDKRYSGIRILVITGKSDEETIGLATKCGADGYLVKPFTFEDVLDKVTAILGATD